MKKIKSNSVSDKTNQKQQDQKLIYKTTPAYKRKSWLKCIITNPFKKY